MFRSAEEVLANIDATLDQLICNAEMMHTISIEAISEMEIGALQKTQESLLAHVLHMDTLLDQKKKEQLLQKKQGVVIEQKISHFSRLNNQLVQDIANRFKVKSKRALRINKD